MGCADGGDVKPPSVIIGYDPGGNGCHGIARLLVRGGKATSVETMALATTEDVICFIEGQESLVALGVDTLSCWYTGRSSWRPADLWLRDRYPAVRNSVVNANALFGSMGLNGMAVLLTARRTHPDVLITETHPKVLYHQMTGRKYDYARCGEAMDLALADALGVEVRPGNEHEWDASLSALAALEAFTGRWTNDLLQLPVGSGARCVSPCAGTHYFWPE